MIPPTVTSVTLYRVRESRAVGGAAVALMPLNSPNVADRGDFIDSDDEIELDEVAEDPERYLHGLYYPICIGEVIAGRYRIQHKLGHGGFSVVWMAYDIHTRRDVALKIMMPGDSGDREYHMHTEITNAVPDTSRLLLCLDTFFLAGSYDSHRVLVLPLQGPNLRDHLREKPIIARMRAAKQLLQGLKMLHSGAIVHRDLNDANVMFGLLPIDCHDATTKYRYLGRPKKTTIPGALWKPGELVAPMAPKKELVTDDILIGDFGLAIRAGAPVAQKVQSPAVFCAPERVHGADPSFASDMWSYMCLFAQLYMGCPLFWGRANSTVVTFIVDMLGPLPAQWKGLYDAGGDSRAEWYDQHQMPDPYDRLEAKIQRLRPQISAAELELVLAILQWGLSYLPEDRPTAAQLLHSTPFEELMAMYL